MFLVSFKLNGSDFFNGHRTAVFVQCGESAIFSCCNKLNDVFSIDALSFGHIVVPLWMY